MSLARVVFPTCLGPETKAILFLLRASDRISFFRYLSISDYFTVNPENSQDQILVVPKKVRKLKATESAKLALDGACSPYPLNSL